MTTTATTRVACAAVLAGLLSSAAPAALAQAVSTANTQASGISQEQALSLAARLDALEQRNNELRAKALSDPAFRDKAVALAQKMGEAQARGDTVAFRKLAAEMGLTMDDPKPDTLAADKACGREPAKPAVLAQIEQLDAQAQKLTEDIRLLEEKM